MRIRVFAGIIFSLALAAEASAQDFVFKVLANNGSNEFKAKTTSSWRPVKRGVSFSSGDRLRIVDKAYLGLIHSSGVTVELVNPGEFLVEELESKLDPRKKGLGGKYTEYVMNDNLASNDPDQELVTRGAKVTINVLLPSSSRLLNNEVIIPWEPVIGFDGVYQVLVMGIFEEILFTGETRDTQYLLDLSHPSLADEESFEVIIVAKDTEIESMGYSIDRMTGDGAEELRDELFELEQGVNKDSAIDNILLAGFYEGNELIPDAITSYFKAMELSPQVTDFQELYSTFNKRQQIK